MATLDRIESFHFEPFEECPRLNLRDTPEAPQRRTASPTSDARVSAPAKSACTTVHRDTRPFHAAILEGRPRLRICDSFIFATVDFLGMARCGCGTTIPAATIPV
jgi:hypothetical protein